MNDNEPSPKQTPTWEVLVEVVVGIAMVYFLWQPVYNFVSPIVDATLVPVLRALGL